LKRITCESKEEIRRRESKEIFRFGAEEENSGIGKRSWEFRIGEGR
jgi:hypothetical protein